MGLFSKKCCDICGEQIGLLGNRKLEDGNLCRSCAGKLSPWFGSERKATVDQIRSQLIRREENKSAVAAFHPTWQRGRGTVLYLDEKSDTFLVTSAVPFDFPSVNPDIFRLSQVKSCTLELQEERRELCYEDEDGNQSSYTPRRYEYHYNFQIRILLDHPYVEQILFPLNPWPLKIEYSDRSFFGTGTVQPERDSEYRQYLDMAHQVISRLDPGASHYDQISPGF